MNIAMTGATGYIGKHLSNYLTEKGASIWMTRRTENNIIKRGCCTAFDAAAPFCMGA